MRADIESTDQATTAAYVNVGDPIDTLQMQSISFTVVNTTTRAQMYYKVLGGNRADMTDAQVVQAEATLSISTGQTAVGGYSIALAVWRYYVVQVKWITQATTARVTSIVKGAR